MKKMVLFLVMCACFAQAQTSIEDLPKIRNISDSSIVFKISPNPASDEITIDYKLPEKMESGKIIISDLMGKKTAEYKINRNAGILKISVSEFLRGIYFCRLESGKYGETKKIILK